MWKRFVVGAALLAISTGCKGSATQPSSGSPSGTPAIVSTSPSLPSLSETPQLLTVSGHDFETGIVGTLTTPTGVGLTLDTSEFRQLTATSFQLSVIFDVAGNYSLQLKNTNGSVSTPWTVTVGSATQGALTLTFVSPTTTVANTQPQAIVVNGVNFDPSLTAIITAPDSLQSFYGPELMSGLNSTSFALNVIFDKVGTYTIVVRNSANSVSNSVTVDVRKQ